MAERHRENVAGQGAEAKRLAALRRIAIGKKLAGALWQSAIGKKLLARETIQTIIGKNLLAKKPAVRSIVFEHKIGIFVRFCPPEPLFSGVLSTKSRFLCAFTLQNPYFWGFRAQNRGFCTREE